ncbi:unnamed protein product [Rangifer tarandus platyrhynchus]|uniref:Uncharacterized protein n=2 Tax=Rangifer tarandus platyrhynchus TaxID=3082113 RepID=A0AC59YWG7_RANTA|nr:unnamed protein product [Rangifer tarandus platyrhynchus]
MREMRPSSDDVTWPLYPSWPLGLAGPTPELFSHVSHCIPTITTLPFFWGGGVLRHAGPQFPHLSQTCTACSGSSVLTTGPPGKSLYSLFLKNQFAWTFVTYTFTFW